MSTPETPKKFPNSRHLSSARFRQKRTAAARARAKQTEALPESGNRYSWVVNGMDCAACARKVENAVKQVPRESRSGAVRYRKAAGQRRKRRQQTG